MIALQVIFYVLSAVAIFSGLMVVASNSPVRGALFLVLTFFATAGLWILLHAEFLALILVLVYVGAVMTLFLFVVMMLSVSRLGTREGFVRYLPLCALIVLLMIGLIVMVVGPHQYGLLQFPSPLVQPSDFSNTASLGSILYTNYAYPFEVAAALLLTAIVAAISLTHRPSSKQKKQDASAQIAVQRADRVELIKMAAEPKIKLVKKDQS